jgi:hypothetical protein
MRVLPGLANYWPPLDEVRAIGTEAESLPDAVLLAVHRHIDLVRRPFMGSDSGRRVQEDALLDFVLHGLKPEGYLLAPVTGPSGAGKSHLVRWLEIRLRNHPEATRFHVIRVPKSASLRTVVESVLEPVSHLPEYKGMLDELRQAASAISPEEAAAMFGTILELALKERTAIWRQEGGSVDGVPTTTLAAHAPLLASFLQDALLASHFREAVYPRLLKRALRGRQDTDADADRPPRFELEDLVLPPKLLNGLDGAARSTQTYYLTRLDRDGGREAALAALNAVIDNVVARVFKLGQLSRGKSLQDMMIEIRRSLAESGRELVLLVEDFYALTGIQDQLLSFCIQEVIDEPRPMCPMRTVMAMTDSTLDGRDTIKTRSEYQWALVTEEHDEERIVDALTDIAGRYLNAARIGRQRLVNSYDPSAGTVLATFVPESDDPEGSELRQVFGSTDNGIPLFPLSRQAIHFLARKHLVQGGRMHFIPRIALKFIVRNVLEARAEFEHGQFPSGIDIEDLPAVELTGILNSTPSALRARYQRTVVCWGNNPSTPADLATRLHADLFRAFGLDPLGIASAAPAPTQRTATASGARPTTAAAPAPEHPTAAVSTKWRPIFDNWVNGQRLDLAHARELRRLLHAYAIANVDWNALCLSPDEFDASSFEIPQALGQNRRHKTERPVIRIGESAGTDLARELLSLVRFDASKQWDYAEAEDDAMYLADLLARLASVVASAALKAAESKLAALAAGSVRAGAIRTGLADPASLRDCLAAALLVNDTAPLASGAKPWDELRKDCWDKRDIFRKCLLRYLQVVQGAGQVPHAVDAARFQRALFSPALDSSAINERLVDDGEAQPNAALLVRLTSPRIAGPRKAAYERVEKWYEQVMSAVGLKHSSEDLAGFRDSALKLVDTCMLSGLWPSHLGPGLSAPTVEEAKERISHFAGLGWENMVNGCNEVITANTDSAEVLNLIATLPWNEMASAQDFVRDYGQWLDTIGKRVAGQEAVLGGGNAGAAIQAILSELEGIASDFELGADT